MIAVTFALPEESREFRAELAGVRVLEEVGCAALRGTLEQEEVVVLHTGIGVRAARRHTLELCAATRPELLVAAGFAGGLDAGLALGDLVLAKNVSDAALLIEASNAAEGAALRCLAGKLVTTEHAAETVAEKAALAAAGNAAVDMETEGIAMACHQAGVPLLAVRAISDVAAEALPVPLGAWFDLERQRPNVGGLLAFLVSHPGRILPFVRFVRGLAPARRSLAAFLVHFIAGSRAKGAVMSGSPP